MTVLLHREPALAGSGSRAVAATGGGAVTLGALLRIVAMSWPGLGFLPGGVLAAAHLVGAVLIPLGLLVLALGLPGGGRRGRGRRGGGRGGGVLGPSRAVRVLVAAAAAIDLLWLVAWTTANRLVSDLPGLGSISYLPFVLLIAASVVLARTPASTRYARVGVAALALLGVIQFAADFAVAVAAPILDAGFSDGAQLLATPLVWLSRFVTVLAVAVGVWFAWPRLSEPRL